MSDSLTRTIDDHTVPAAGTYAVDATHSSASFQVRHMGLSKVRGSLDVTEATVERAGGPRASSVIVTLDAASMDTGNADRDGHVKSGDFLDVEAFPTMTYRSTGVRADGDVWVVDGELTVRDVTQPVALTVEFEGAGQDPWGNGRIAFSGRAEVNRDDFGITWNQTLETGGVLVGKKVTIDLDVQAVAAPSTAS